MTLMGEVWVCGRNNCLAGCKQFKSSSLPDYEKLNWSQHRSNWTMEFDGYIGHGNATPAMVIIVILHNDISHVWHRLVVNLEVNSYN